MNEESFELKGSDGTPIYVISNSDKGIHFWWEYYARPGIDEPDLEVSFDIEPETIEKIFQRFNVLAGTDYMSGFKMISDSGNGNTLQKEILDGVFPISNKFSWMSW